jgi:hypothetical protein
MASFKRGDGAVSIIDPTGRRLKIPVWMLLPECAEIKITEQPRLSKEALLSLTSLLSTPHNPNDHDRDNLLQTAVDGCRSKHFEFPMMSILGNTPSMVLHCGGSAPGGLDAVRRQRPFRRALTKCIPEETAGEP